MSFAKNLCADKLLERVQEVNKPTVTRLRRTQTSDGRPTSPHHFNGGSPRRNAPTRLLSGQGGPRRAPTLPSSDSSDQVDLLESSDDEQEVQQQPTPRRRPQRTRSADTSTLVYQRPRGSDRTRRTGADGTDEVQPIRRRIQRSKSEESSPRGAQRVPRAGRRRPGREEEEDYDEQIDEEDELEEVGDDEKDERAAQPRRNRPNRTRSTPNGNPRRARSTAQNLQSRQMAQMARSDQEQKSGFRVPRSKSMDLTAPGTEGRALRGDRRAMREERMQARLEKQRQQIQQQQQQQQKEEAPDEKPEPAWKRRLRKKSLDDSLNFDDVLDSSNQSGNARFSASMPTVPVTRRSFAGFEGSFTSEEILQSSQGFADFDDTNASSSFDGSYNEPMQDPMSSSMPGRTRRKSRASLKKLDAFHSSIPRETVLEESAEDFDAFGLS